MNYSLISSLLNLQPETLLVKHARDMNSGMACAMVWEGFMRLPVESNSNEIAFTFNPLSPWETWLWLQMLYFQIHLGDWPLCNYLNAPVLHSGWYNIGTSSGSCHLPANITSVLRFHDTYGVTRAPRGQWINSNNNGPIKSTYLGWNS